MNVLRATLLLTLAAPTFSGEGFWPMHSIPLERIKAEVGVELTPEWIARATKSAAMIRMSGSGGSGVVVSADGLVLTNRHVVIEYLGTLSPPGKNFVKDGFLAANPEAELRCPNLRVRVLLAQEKMPERQIQVLQQAADARAEARVRRQIEQAQYNQRGNPCEVVGLHGGSEYWLYVYREFTDVRFVYTPDQGLGDFGGREDNFSYPRHEIDIAFLRVYQDGKPAKTEDYLRWSPKPVAENDPVFLVGHPAENERGAPLSYMRFLCESRFPAQSAVFDGTVDALANRLREGGPLAARLEPDLHRTHNRFKLTASMREILMKPEVIAQLKDREAALRKRIDASPAAKAALGTAYEDCADACAQMKSQAAIVELTDLRQLRLNAALEALVSFSQRAEGLEGEQLARISRSIQTFLRDGPLSTSYNAAIDEAHIAGHLAAIEKTLPLDHPLRTALLKGVDAATAAKRIVRESKLSTADGCCELVLQGAKSIRESKDPALEFIRAIQAYEVEHAAELAAFATQELRRQQSMRTIQRAIYAENVKGEAPATNRTARLAVGNVSGYEIGGIRTPWHTTFRTQLEKAALKKEEPPFTPSPLLKNASKDINLDTPLNFVMTTDGGPGCSGAPVLDRDGRVVGILFDGNSARVASLYYYAPIESGARSIAIHSSAIELGLRLANAADLLKELQTGGR